MKNYKIITLNAAGYGWKGTESWNNRLERICSYMSQKSKDSLAIGLQEVQLTGGKHLAKLEEHFPDYYIILPSAWKNQPKSAVSLLLLNKNIVNLEDCNVRTIPGLEDNLLYNYVSITCSGEELVLLNVHVPPKPDILKAQWYREERDSLRSTFYSKIQRIAESEPNLVLLGDMNTVPISDVMENLVNSEGSPMRDSLCENQRYSTTCKNSKVEARLDYILLSRALSTNITAKVDNTTMTTNPPMSDHSLLIAEVNYV